MRVQIVGAGFSGLTLGYLLSKRGLRVDILERESKPGGVLHTDRQPDFFAESAANGLLLTKNVEAMFHDLKVPMIKAKAKARRRYIFRGKMRRWPLTIRETIPFLIRLGWSWLSGRIRPQPLESIEKWGLRCLGAAPTQYLLAPALQGIYAGDISQLSAPLIFGQKKTRYQGLVAPLNGMSELVDGLITYIEKAGGTIRFKEGLDPRSPGSICAVSAKEFQKYFYPSLELLSLLKVTVRWRQPQHKINGYGVLFPRGQNIRALGVLSSEDIFGRRLERDTESWIYGGALDPSSIQLSDSDILEQIKKDRQLLLGEICEVEQISISRWQDTLPHYTVALEAFVNEFDSQNHRFFTGNYLGQLGLSRIFERNHKIADEWGLLVQ